MVKSNKLIKNDDKAVKIVKDISTKKSETKNYKQFEIKKINLWSFIKISVIIATIYGFLQGLLIVLFSGGDSAIQANSLFITLGYWMILLVPVLYLVLSAILSALLGLLYNLFAKLFGGITLSLEEK